MKTLRWLQARWTLAVGVLRHLALRPFVGRRGPGPWLARLRAERLVQTPLDQWLYLAGTSRCIGCGLCDTTAASDEWPSSWIRASIRRPEDAPLAVGQARSLRALAAAISRVCPTRVPAADVARLIEAHAKTLASP